MVTVYLWLHGSVPVTNEIHDLLSCEYYRRWSKQFVTLERRFLPFVAAAEQSSMESVDYKLKPQVDEVKQVHL